MVHGFSDKPSIRNMNTINKDHDQLLTCMSYSSLFDGIYFVTNNN